MYEGQINTFDVLPWTIYKYERYILWNIEKPKKFNDLKDIKKKWIENIKNMRIINIKKIYKCTNII